MTNHIPRSFIDELLARTDIIEWIERRVPLKKTGSNFNACCPFHNEKTPSFTVSPQKQFYHCFGCGAHGNVISFLMEYDHLEFVEAIEELANHLGLPIPQEVTNAAQQRQTPLYTLLEKTANYYQQQLTRNEAAKTYLTARGLSAAIIQRFNLGFAPAAWHNIQPHFKPTAQSLSEYITTGILIKNEQGKIYDRFRNRIMFPIKDSRGHIIGFGGRALGEETPKYLNSPETPLFHKGSELYGLYEARQSNPPPTQILVVEGYMDVIALHQFGITNAVATLGTATSAKHLQRLFRYYPEIIFCFDGDRAGFDAAWRALEVSLPVIADGLQIRFMFLPSGEDPDSMIRKIGATHFQQQIQQALPLEDFFFEHLCQQVNLQTLEGKAKLASLAQNLLYKIQNGVFQQLMLEKLASLVGMNVTTLSQHYEEKRPTATPSVPAAKSQGLSSVPLAIALLLQYPALAATHPLPEALQDINLPGMEHLRKLFERLKANPNLNTGSLLEHWRDSKAAARLGELAQWDFFNPAPEIQSRLLSDAFNGILAQDREKKILILEDKRTQQGLTVLEKESLFNLYKERHEQQV
ncbi:MAG TPA: DNA primase [Gammaproteobacteria bacterium]|nr:DNA primase [Gammaproteobacteria bacterium]